MSNRPIRILELRSVRGTGGGPEKTILHGAARSDSGRFRVTVCYIRDRRDRVFALDQAAARRGIDYVEVTERHSFDPAIWPALRRLVRDRGIDILHAHEYKTDLLALLLARAEGVVPLSTVHGWTGHARRERLIYYPADRRLLRRFPRLIAVSGQIRDQLVRSGVPAAKIATILNGIDPSAFRRDADRGPRARAELGVAPTDVVVGAVGRLEPQKRFDLLIDAVAQLRDAGRNLRLLIAGAGSRRSELAARISRRGLDDVCTLAGHRSDVVNVFHAMDMFVQSSDYEGTSNAVLEAMALEVPVVATSAGGTAEQITHDVHGLIVPPGSAAVLAAAIACTLDDHEATTRRTAAARRRVERELSFDTRMRHIEAIYEELADTSSPLAPPRQVVA